MIASTSAVASRQQHDPSRIGRMFHGHRMQVHPLRVRAGDEWFMVRSGTVELLLDVRSQIVETGDAASFSTMVPHATGAYDGPAEVLLVLDRDGDQVHQHLAGQEAHATTDAGRSVSRPPASRRCRCTAGRSCSRVAPRTHLLVMCSACWLGMHFRHLQALTSGQAVQPDEDLRKAADTAASLRRCSSGVAGFGLRSGRGGSWFGGGVEGVVVDESADRVVEHGCCSPDGGLIEELSQTALGLLQQPGVTTVQLRAGCHVVEVHCERSGGRAGDRVESGANGGDFSTWAGEDRVAGGRHRRGL